MVYKVIGLMSGSSLDGLDLAYVHLQEKAATGKGFKSWEYTLVHTVCYPYSDSWRQRLAGAAGLSALAYQLLHAEYGRYLGEQVLRFIEEFGLHFQVQLIASHGHTAFHQPGNRMTAQLGDGAALAAVTRINVVSDLRSMDVALGGQGAPIVPVGEKWLFPEYEFFLNLGGIANVSRQGGVGVAGGRVEGVGAFAGSRSGADAGGADAGGFAAFDVCPANRVLNALAAPEGLAFDEGGRLAGSGRVDAGLLARLNALPYYERPGPKSLANEFGTETVLPLVLSAGLSARDALCTYVEHIAVQTGRALGALLPGAGADAATGAGVGVGAATGGAGAGTDAATGGARLLVTGGGAHNGFLVSRLKEVLMQPGIDVVVPAAALVDYKEALVMALIGVLRWREENNVLASVTGASRDSIGGAVWIGQEG